MIWTSVNEKLPEEGQFVFVMFQHHPDCTDQALWFAQFKDGEWYGNELNFDKVKLEGVPICWCSIPKSLDTPSVV